MNVVIWYSLVLDDKDKASDDDQSQVQSEGLCYEPQVFKMSTLYVEMLHRLIQTCQLGENR